MFQKELLDFLNQFDMCGEKKLCGEIERKKTVLIYTSTNIIDT